MLLRSRAFPILTLNSVNKYRNLYLSTDTSVQYVQGQSPKPGIREYFYFIDHQGMLFLDDARMKNFTSCFKEQKFLVFFFKQLRVNATGRYLPQFPYVSLCGKERNYVRCDDLPIVFTHILKVKDGLHLTFNYGGDKLVFPFQPEKLYMGSTGRIYHPGPEQLHGIGLVRSQLGLEISKDFVFERGEDDSPTHFCYEGDRYELDGSLKPVLRNMGRDE